VALPLFLLIAAATAPDGRAESGVRTDLRVLPAYFSGTYGTGIDTSIVYVPLILAVSSARQDFRLTIPYLSINTSEPVIYLDGEVIGPVPGGTTSESGLGDIFAQEEFFFVQGGARRPWVSAILRVKFPTADETKGLGSGQLDYGGGLGIIQPLGPAWSLIGALQYVVRGDPAGVDFRNTAWITFGTQWRPSKVNSWNAFYDRRQSVIPGNSDLADLSLGYDRLLSPGISFRSTVYIGLSDTTEDFGLSAGLSFTPGQR
jgi:outer membrane putative beta-barrel porin/alpha-amylase